MRTQVYWLSSKPGRSAEVGYYKLIFSAWSQQQNLNSNVHSRCGGAGRRVLTHSVARVFLINLCHPTCIAMHVEQVPFQHRTASR